MDAQTYTGRPSKNAEFKLYDGKLYQLLLEKLPSKFIKFGRLDTLKLCEATGNARYTVYRWLNEQVLSRNAIKALVKLSDETDEQQKKAALTKEDLIPFLGL
ncbi:hypothetical protein [Mesorhizobium sp.]|uniref:hypothetical protein n=1 Tax=Mesorhizobium sp. TaxID=1871066 RepID=UPI000FEA0878|nr:hypothetical protein [Mesorhizobium sp.]RWP29503.1 MAG: hypothetical protein EOR03_26620 [Mesorhizobium sp.]RWP69517.1 MAG: hypothetical protein EOR07_03050 [Mesorhizobium sp.]